MLKLTIINEEAAILNNLCSLNDNIAQGKDVSSILEVVSAVGYRKSLTMERMEELHDKGVIEYDPCFTFKETTEFVKEALDIMPDDAWNDKGGYKTMQHLTGLMYLYAMKNMKHIEKFKFITEELDSINIVVGTNIKIVSDISLDYNNAQVATVEITTADRIKLFDFMSCHEQYLIALGDDHLRGWNLTNITRRVMDIIAYDYID